jgi:hypothetical protein
MEAGTPLDDAGGAAADRRALAPYSGKIGLMKPPKRMRLLYELNPNSEVKKASF